MTNSSSPRSSRQSPNNSSGTASNGKVSPIKPTLADAEILAAVNNEPVIEWQSPVMFGEKETVDIPTNLLPEGWLRDFVDGVSLYAQTPPAMAILLALAVVATAVQRKFIVTPYSSRADYTESLSLWVLVMLPPASRKTYVLNKLIEPLQDWETEQATQRKSEIDSHELKRKTAEQRITHLQGQAAKEDDRTKREKLIAEMTELRGEMPEEMKAPCLFTGDATNEHLQTMLAEQSERMSVISDEGGVFEVITGLYSNGAANFDVYLKSHVGAGLRVNRAKRSVKLKRPALSIGLTIQPAVWCELGTGNKKRLRGTGLLARFLLCIPRNNIGFRDVKKQKPVEERVLRAYREGIFKLLDLKPEFDEYEEETARLITLSPAALDSWYAFSEEVERKQGPGGEFESIQDWTGKLPGAALRIAALCHLAETFGTTPIRLETMAKAVGLCRLLIVHAVIAFDIVGADASLQDAKHILAWLVAQGQSSFKRNDLHRTGRFNKSKLDRLIAALDVLIERHIISECHALKTKKPSYVYYVNPALVPTEC